MGMVPDREPPIVMAYITFICLLAVIMIFLISPEVRP